MSALRNVLATSVVLAVACGGSAANNVTAGDGGGVGVSDGSLSSSSGSSSGSTDSGGGDDSGLVEVDDSGYIPIPGGDDASEDEEAGSSSGGSSSSSGGASVEAGIGVTSPPHGTDGGAFQIECGATPCNSMSQVCCASALGRMCTLAGDCAGDSLACSGTNSCASGVCCESISEGGRTLRTECRAACPVGSPQLCTTDADCTKANQYCHKYGSYAVCERLPAALRDQ